ncbi:hypothetical protein JXM67_08970 [candidate division WOR-3 bacterium]|nr:hypothetical protein [candidate division WOR-3 bacterium]
MRKKRTPLIAIAIAVLAVAATSVFAYYEMWWGFFSDGYLVYNSNYYYHPNPGAGGPICDSTISDDEFYMTSDGIIVPFIDDVNDDTIWLTITDASGSKTTGRSRTKSVTNGAWSGSGRRTAPDPDQTFTVISGTWQAAFMYDENPDSFAGTWTADYSDPSGISGTGKCEGDIGDFSTSEPCDYCD